MQFFGEPREARNVLLLDDLPNLFSSFLFFSLRDPTGLVALFFFTYPPNTRGGDF